MKMNKADRLVLASMSPEQRAAEINLMRAERNLERAQQKRALALAERALLYPDISKLK